MTETPDILRDRRDRLRDDITFLRDLLDVLREYPECSRGVGEVVATVEGRMNVEAAEIAAIDRRLDAGWAAWETAELGPFRCPECGMARVHTRLKGYRCPKCD
jgi:hypothetical protein